MKKNLLILVLAIIAIAITPINCWGVTLSNPQQLTVSSTQGCTHTDPNFRLGQICDNNPATIWATKATTPSEAWFEIGIATPAYIDYLEFAGIIANSGETSIYYLDANGVWQPFLGCRTLTLTNGRIDLSWNRAFTDRLRFQFRNTSQLTRLGNIGELKIYGHAKQALTKLNGELSATSADSNYPASFLNDSNTNTAWRTSGSSAAVTITLPRATLINRVKYITRQGSGNLSFSALVNGSWISFGPITDLATVSGWQTVTTELTATAIKLSLADNGGDYLGGIAEVEVWGEADSELKKSILLAENNNGINTKFTLNDLSLWDSATLWLTLPNGSNLPPGNINFNLNGKNVPTGYTLFPTPGGNLAKFTLAVSDLRSGSNNINVAFGSVTFNAASLVLTPKTGMLNLTAADNSGILSGLTDGYLFTGNTTVNGALELQLTGPASVDALQIYSSLALSGITLSIWQDGAWVQLDPASLQIEGSLILINGGTAPTTKLRIEATSDLLNSITEVEALGSTIIQGPPQVTITEPAPYTLLTPNQTIDLKGYVDNPDVTLTVDGNNVSLQGYYFSYPLIVPSGATEGNRTVTVVATDSQGQVGQASLIYNINSQPIITCDLPELQYTNASQLLFGGTATNVQTVKVNGTPVNLVNGTYSFTVDLNEGENLITVEATNESGAVTRLERRVIRDTMAPVMLITRPENGSTVTIAQLQVSGSSQDASPVNLTINGQVVTLNDGVFNTTVTLQSGANTLTIQAQDQVGNVATLTLNVTYSPMDLEITCPLEGAYTNVSTTVSGRVIGPAPAELLVNGTSVIPAVDGSFSIIITLPGGANTIYVTATAYDGNQVSKTINLIMDSETPQPFTVTSNTSGWSSNNRPTLTFSTTDTGSGVDHYTVQVDNGAWSGAVISPYQFPNALADGEHLVKVRAVDKAGNETVSEVTVYIDTTEPATPANFEVISGIGRAVLQWSDPKGEINGYRIRRTPGFAEGEYRDIWRSADEYLNRFIDLEVVADQTYTYTLEAIDRAGNFSSATTAWTVKIGIAVLEVAPSGGTDKFDNCVVTISPETGALFATSSLTVQASSPTLPENNGSTDPSTPVALKVGSSYSLALYDQAGNPIEAEFNENPVELTIDYSQASIPEGYTIDDLGLYWYNSSEGIWERVEQTANDCETNKISADLYHFSDYQLMASEFVSPSLQSYYDMGVSPYQAYHRENVETVSAVDGSLSLATTDLVLPGRDGFNLEIRRIYDSNFAQQEKVIETNHKIDSDIYRKTPIDTFGSGWALNIPWVETTDSGKFLRLPFGQTIKINLNNHNLFEYHEGIHFVYKKLSSTNYELTMKDGTRYYFNNEGKVTKALDPSGKNQITYAYIGREITKITDSIGREVIFTYKTVGSIRLIEKIEVGTTAKRTISYDYNATGLLWKSTDPKARVTEYGYDTAHTLWTGYGRTSEATRKIKSYNLQLLNKITYPTKESSNYTYDYRDQTVIESGYKSADCRIVVSRHQVKDKIVDYTFTMNQKSGGIKTNYFIPAYTYMLSSEVKEGGRNTKQTFKQIDGTKLVDTLTKASSHKGALVYTNQTFINNTSEVEKGDLSV